MSAEGHPGYCSWHAAWSTDVVLVNAHEGGSGPGGGAYACLPCVQPLLRRRGVSEWLRRQVEAMEERAKQAAPKEASS